METLFNQVVYNLSSVNSFHWLLVYFYFFTLSAIYHQGLPFKKAYTTPSTEQKEVSHGISTELQTVYVYNAWYTEANAITILGAIGLIIIIFMSITETSLASLPVLYIIAVGYSDVLDGLACKRWNCHSHIGAILDPVRDRLAIVTIIFCILGTIGFSIFWIILMLFVIILEICSSYVNKKAQKNGTPVNSHGAGKVRQAVHILACSIILTTLYLLNLPEYMQNIVIIFLVGIMAIASTFAFVKYNNNARQD